MYIGKVPFKEFDFKTYNNSFFLLQYFLNKWHNKMLDEIKQPTKTKYVRKMFEPLGRIISKYVNIQLSNL